MSTSMIIITNNNNNNSNNNDINNNNNNNNNNKLDASKINSKPIAVSISTTLVTFILLLCKWVNRE